MFKRVPFVTLALLASTLSFADQGSAAQTPHCLLEVKLLPKQHALEGKARITLPAGTKARFRTGALTLKKVIIGKEEYPAEPDALSSITVEEEKIIEISYRGVFDPTAPQEKIENTGTAGSNAIGPAGITLFSGWYPELAEDCRYDVKVLLPSDFTAISESDTTVSSTLQGMKETRFHFPHPVSGITLIAAKYVVRKETFHGITLKTLLFSEDSELASTYLEHTKKYIELYESMLGTFPYKSFSIVENRFQTGLSFPTYTLLGSQVIRLPFIVKTSLGHEILHQWFGNSVYVDAAGGNWAEGLTTYLADHWYDHLRGEGAVYRKKILIDYRNYVSSEKEIPLKDFRSRKNFATRTVGYGKTAMLFHMLRKKLGDETFFKGLQEFISANSYRYASWDAIQNAFASLSSDDLAPFFEQWVNTKGAPGFQIKNPSVVFREGNYLLSFDIVQHDPSFTFDLPLRIVGEGYTHNSLLHVDESEVHVEKSFAERPFRILIDPDYDLFREIADEERPPVISAFTGNKGSLVIVPEENPAIYQEAEAFFESQGYSIKKDVEVTQDEIRKNSLLIFSDGNKVYKQLFGGTALSQGGCVVQAMRNPLNPKHTALIMNANNSQEMSSAFHKIFRYGNTSKLVFEKGKVISKGTTDSVSGIVKELKLSVEAIEPRKILGLDQVLSKIKDRRVVFVGESHTSYAHHVMQLEIITRLFHEKGKLMIGMEMFQKPFQSHLDRYVQGEITEDEFLKKTEYFTRWKFEYNLYRDILQFARANSLPVIALNLRREVVEKVAKQGIDALTDEEASEIPQDMDMTHPQYRSSLQEVFSQHGKHFKQNAPAGKNFVNFFQAQILWDETMAHSVAEALRKYPDTQMVVLAGNGHLQNAWGIPDRVKRLTGATTTIILNDTREGIRKGLADFVLFPAKMETPKSPKLMVMLEETDQGVVVQNATQGGAAEKAGILKGDIIRTIDEKKIADIQDIKILLLNRKKGDTIKIKIDRRRFVLGSRTRNIEVLL